MTDLRVRLAREAALTIAGIPDTPHRADAIARTVLGALDAYADALGDRTAHARVLGATGGRARRDALTVDERKALARHAAQARWHKRPPPATPPRDRDHVVAYDALRSANLPPRAVVHEAGDLPHLTRCGRTLKRWTRVYHREVTCARCRALAAIGARR